MKTYVLSTLLMVLSLSMVPVLVAEVNLDDVTMKLREKTDGQVNKRLRLPEKDAASFDKRKLRDPEKIHVRQHKEKFEKGLKASPHKEKLFKYRKKMKAIDEPGVRNKKALDSKEGIRQEQLKRKIFKGKKPIGDEKKNYYKKNKQRHEKLLKAKREINAIDDPALRAEKIKAMKMKAMKIPPEKRALIHDKKMNEKNIIQERKKLDEMYKKVNRIKDDKVREEKLKYLEGYKEKIKGREIRAKKGMDIDNNHNIEAIKKAKTKKELGDIRRKVGSIKDPVIREKTIRYLKDAYKKMDAGQ